MRQAGYLHERRRGEETLHECFLMGWRFKYRMGSQVEEKEGKGDVMLWAPGAVVLCG